MTILAYKSRAMVEDLQANECTIHRATSSQAARWWLLWFYAPRDTDGGLEVFGVPVNPNGDTLENGPGGQTWSLRRGEGGLWLISPSINVLDTRDAFAGAKDQPSIWHHTPILTGVSEDEPWITQPP